MRKHIQHSHSDLKKFTCDVEGCTFSTKGSSNLSKHKLYKHSDIYKYSCFLEDCGFVCKEKQALAVHVTTAHTKDAKFQCDVCGEAFTRNVYLQRHTHSVHGVKWPLQCSETLCDFGCLHAYELRQHFHSLHTPEGHAERRREEKVVARALDAEFPEGIYVREHNVDYTCISGKSAGVSRSRLDFLIPVAGAGKIKGHVILEVDEHQHAWYGQGCETARMANVVSSLRMEGNTMPIAWIRYNPHAFKVNNVTKRVTQKDRLQALIGAIRKMKFGAGREVRVAYMYYDTVNGDPCVLDDPEYSASVREWYAGCRV